MSQNAPFSRIIIEPAANGYVIEIEGENNDVKYVYPSLRIAIREIKKHMQSGDSRED